MTIAVGVAENKFRVIKVVTSVEFDTGRKAFAKADFQLFIQK